MLAFERGAHEGLKVCPRWPAKQVLIDETAWERLKLAQDSVPAGVRLIVTRGYEPVGVWPGFVRRRLRAVGIRLFRAVYRARRDEIGGLFGANGHDVDGTHVDVSVELNGRRLSFLPLGVFTPLYWQERRVRPHFSSVEAVKAALIESGFQIHTNKTESLQIHCDLAASRAPAA
jgi:hypothetical protein